MKALTLLGMVFVPLAFTSGLFNMAAPFGPGNLHFRVYFAVALPLILLVFAVAFGVNYLGNLSRLANKETVPKGFGQHGKRSRFSEVEYPA